MTFGQHYGWNGPIYDLIWLLGSIWSHFEECSIRYCVTESLQWPNAFSSVKYWWSRACAEKYFCDLQLIYMYNFLYRVYFNVFLLAQLCLWANWAFLMALRPSSVVCILLIWYNIAKTLWWIFLGYRSFRTDNLLPWSFVRRPSSSSASSASALCVSSCISESAW